MICYLFQEPTFFFFTTGVPELLYYSYIPTIIVVFIVGLYVLLNGPKILLNRLFFVITTLLSIWTVLNLIQWTNIHSGFVLFAWSVSNLILALLAVFSIYFFEVFLDKKDVSIYKKLLYLFLLMPAFLFTHTNINLSGFNLTTCDAFEFEGGLFKIYLLLLGVLAIIWISVITTKRYSYADVEFKKQILLMSRGLLAFLFMFFLWTNLIAHLTSLNLLPDSQLELYGMFGVLIFMVYIGVLMVRFKTFDTKIFGAQVLVFSIIILTGSQLFYTTDTVAKIITSGTLIATGIIGIYLIRSVKKEIEAREKIQKLAEKLDHSVHSLQEANESQKTLIHIMNHQIKGYFTVNRNIFSELLSTDDYGVMPEPAKPLLSKGLESSTAGVDYVYNILAGSSAASGTLPFNMKPVDIKICLEAVIPQQKEIAEKAGLTFETKIEEAVYTTTGDETQLKEMFKNLITNAIKYNTPQGKVSLILSRKADTIVFSVKDTGIGIADEDKPRLFSPGGRGKNSAQYNADSSGFGLAFVKGVVEAHKGRVSYTSNAPENGTTFTVHIPVATQ